MEWSDSDGDPGVDYMRGGAGGGILREDRMGGGIEVESTGGGTGGTEGTPFLKLLSGGFTSSTQGRYVVRSRDQRSCGVSSLGISKSHLDMGLSTCSGGP